MDHSLEAAVVGVFFETAIEQFEQSEEENANGGSLNTERDDGSSKVQRSVGYVVALIDWLIVIWGPNWEASRNEGEVVGIQSE